MVDGFASILATDSSGGTFKVPVGLWESAA